MKAMLCAYNNTVTQNIKGIRGVVRDRVIRQAAAYVEMEE